MQFLNPQLKHVWKGVPAAGAKFTARSASCGPSMRSEMRLQARFDRLFRDAVDQSCLRMGLLLMFVLDEINLGHTPRNIRLTKRPAHTRTHQHFSDVKPPCVFSCSFLSSPTLSAFRFSIVPCWFLLLYQLAIVSSSRDDVPEIHLRTLRLATEHR